MYLLENKVGEVQIGRHKKAFRTDEYFLLSQFPEWLTATGVVTYQNNGIKLDGTSIKIESCLFSVDTMDMVSIELFNLLINSRSANISLKLISEDAQKEIGIYADTINQYSCFKIINKDLIGGSYPQFATDGVIYNSGEIQKVFDRIAFIWADFHKSGTPRVGCRNIRMLICPYHGDFQILENGISSYIFKDLRKYREFDTNVHDDGYVGDIFNFSGKWRWVLESNGWIETSGIELIIQQSR